MVTDFSAKDKASGVKFCMAVHRRPRQGISHFCELCSPEAQNLTNRPATLFNVMLLGFCDSHVYQVRAPYGRYFVIIIDFPEAIIKFARIIITTRCS